jgi:hypothetical protein
MPWILLPQGWVCLGTEFETLALEKQRTGRRRYVLTFIAHIVRSNSVNIFQRSSFMSVNVSFRLHGLDV